MDTREKILSLEKLPALLATGNWALVVGTFDPLTLTQAERLAVHAVNGTRTLAVVLSGTDTLLTANARAALVASLRSVNAVVVADQDWKSKLPSSGDLHIFEDTQEERARANDFVEFIKTRQRSAEPAIAAAK